MRKEVYEVLNAFKNSFDDEHFSKAEKHLIQPLMRTADLAEDELAYLRNRLFEFADKNLTSHDASILLSWLQKVLKTLYNPPNEASISEVYFSPGDGCLNAINRYLRNASSSIKLCIFTITDNRISQEILRCHKNGIQIQIISDNDKSLDRGSDIELFSNAGIDVRIDNTQHHMHHKFAIIDHLTVITGSYNWTRSAAEHNHENIIISNQVNIVRDFVNEFGTLWEQMTPYTQLQHQ